MSSSLTNVEKLTEDESSFVVIHLGNHLSDSVYFILSHRSIRRYSLNCRTWSV